MTGLLQRWSMARCLSTCCVSRARCCAGPFGSGRFHMLAGSARPMIDWVRDLARAAANHGGGSCAAFGGITASGSNPGRCLWPAIRRQPPRWPAGRRLSLRRRAAGDQRGRLPHASQLGARDPGAGPVRIRRRRSGCPRSARAVSPISWCIMVVRATSTTSTRPAHGHRRSSAA